MIRTTLTLRLRRGLLLACAGMAALAGSGAFAANGAGETQKAIARRAAATGDSASLYGDYLAARIAQLDHDWKTAAVRIRRVWAADRDNASLRHDTLLLSVSAGDFAAALDVAHTIPQDSSDWPLASFVLTLDDIAQGRYPAAIQRLAANQGGGIERYMVPVLQAWCEAGRGKGPDAVAALDKLDGLEGAVELKTIQSAMIWEATGNRDKAAELYDKMIEAKASPHAMIAAANFFIRQGMVDKARAALDKLDPDGGSASVRLAILARIADRGRAQPAPDPRSGPADSLFEVAATLAEQKQADIAPLLYDQFALFLKPNFAAAQLLLAELYQKWGKQDEALSLLQSVDPKSDLKSTADRIAIGVADRAGQSDLAAKLGQQAVKVHPEDIDLQLAYGDFLRQKTKYLEAVSVYDAALSRISQTSNRRGMALFHRGIAYHQAKQWPKAEADLLAALQLRPEDPTLLNYLAFSWADQGINLDRARTMLERAVQLVPDDGAIVDSLGWVMFRAGDYQDAVKQLERAVSLNSGDAVINDHLGDAYWRAGRQIEARGQWEKAARLTDDKALGDQIRTKLKNGLDASGTPQHAAAE